MSILRQPVGLFLLAGALVACSSDDEGGGAGATGGTGGGSSSAGSGGTDTGGSGTGGGSGGSPSGGGGSGGGTTGGGQAGGGASAGGAGGSTAGTGGSDPDGGIACPGPLGDVGPPIIRSCSTGSVPTAGGGIIADGLYYLTAGVDFDAGCAPDDDQAALDIAGDQWRIHSASNQIGGAVTVSGTSVTLEPCGGGDSMTWSFTATADELTLSSAVTGEVRVFTPAALVSTEAGSCDNGLVNDGPDVPEIAGAGSPPAQTGGALADGTYVLSSREDWSGTCGCTRRTKLVVSDGGTVLEAITRGDTDPDTFMSATLTVQGAELTMTFTCPSAMVLVREFSIVAGSTTELHLYDPTNQAREIFTLQ